METEILNINEIPIKTLTTTRTVRSIYSPNGQHKHELLKRREIVEVTEETIHEWIKAMQDKGYSFQEIIEIRAVKENEV